MKIKYLGNFLLVSAIAILFLIPSFKLVKAQEAGTCQCPQGQTLFSGITKQPSCESEVACWAYAAGQGNWVNNSCRCNVGYMARPDIEVGEQRCENFGCVSSSRGTWIVQAAAPQTPAGQGGAQGTPVVQQLPNPLGEGTDIPEIIARVIYAAMGLVGAVGLLMFLYGGFTWMTDGGNEKRVGEGKQILTWAVLGLVVIFTSYAVLSFVIEKLTTPTSVQQNQPQP